MFTPNKLNYARCPHCNILLNQLDWVPMSALANHDFVLSRCPACFEELEVRVHVTFTVETENAHD